MKFLENAWYQNSAWLVLLRPLSALFYRLAKGRREKLERERPSKPVIPTIVVGNISAGGTGKTPVVMVLAAQLTALGLKPAVVSRGYGGKAHAYPLVVDENTPVEQSGDEAKLIAIQTGVPVVVDPDRLQAVEYAHSHFDIDVIISDDGLQHYKMPRSMEIAVVDGKRAFGNGHVFPAGPLREPVSRLQEVDFVLLNGAREEAAILSASIEGADDILDKALELELEPTFLVNQVTGEKKPFLGAPFNMGTTITAVTGIGNPERFFELLADLPYPLEKKEFPDHHGFAKTDFESFTVDAKHPVVMTGKDAIKCVEFADKNFWTLQIVMSLPETLTAEIISTLNLAEAKNKNTNKDKAKKK